MDTSAEQRHLHCRAFAEHLETIDTELDWLQDQLLSGGLNLDTSTLLGVCPDWTMVLSGNNKVDGSGMAALTSAMPTLGCWHVWGLLFLAFYPLHSLLVSFFQRTAGTTKCSRQQRIVQRRSTS